MENYRWIFWALTIQLSLCSMGLQGQTFLFFQSNEHQPIDIPFDVRANLMLTDVKINGYPLRFIFDTGAQQNLLLKKELDAFLNLEYKRSIELHGSDLSKTIVAHLAQAEDFQIADDVHATSSIIVLNEDFLKLDRILGTQVDGIVGSSVFSNSVLYVDNQKRRIRLIPHEDFKQPNDKKYYHFPIEINRGRPYLNAWVTVSGGDEKRLLKFLIDCGSSVPLLIYADPNNGVELPNRTIVGHLGTGLGGNLEGFIGNVENIAFGSFEFNRFPASFQLVQDSIREQSTEISQRDGIIGNGLLTRFNYYIDFHNGILYMKPLKSYKHKFEYDLSGLNLIAGGGNFEYIIVQDVVPNSPAAEAGLLPGDQILRFQGWPTHLYSLAQIHHTLSSKEGKKIRLLIQRGGRELVKSFRLRELL